MNRRPLPTIRVSATSAHRGELRRAQRASADAYEAAATTPEVTDMAGMFAQHSIMHQELDAIERANAARAATAARRHAFRIGTRATGRAATIRRTTTRRPAAGWPF